jgi:hypothetical protein
MQDSSSIRRDRSGHKISVVTFSYSSLMRTKHTCKGRDTTQGVGMIEREREKKREKKREREREKKRERERGSKRRQTNVT